MAATKYPSHNPFPIQATASVEATGREHLSVAGTVDTPQLRRGWQLVGSYLECRSVRRTDCGHILGLYGPAGSGKTHTLRYLLIRTMHKCNEDKTLCGQAYVLPGSSDPIDIQYAVIKELSLEVLRSVTQRFVELIGLEHVERQRLTTEVGRQQRENLRGNLSQIGELIRSALIDPDEISKLQNEALRQAGNEEFKNVISYLDDEKLGDKARKWLCGDPVDPESLLALGVRASERRLDHAQAALRVIVRLFERAGSPLLIFLDQCENFLRPDPNDGILQEGILFLQRLVETLPRDSVFLAVAMNHQVWKMLPDYLKQRFGLNCESFSVLTEKGAREFIHTYIQGSSPTNEQLDILPFEEDAINHILQGVGGNLRGFLQACHLAFHLAFPKRQRITARIVDQALLEAKYESPSLDEVLSQIGATLRDLGLRHSGSGSAAGRASRLIQDRSGKPLAFLEVSEALFIDDEARQGVRTLDVVRRALADPQMLPVIVVVLGYASPEILGTLGRITPHVLVYERDNFRQRFSLMLDDVYRAWSRLAEPVIPLIETRFSELRDEMLRLLQSRTEDTQRTSGFITGVADRQEEDRIQGYWRSARADWIKERKSIEEEIKMAREARLRDELDALEWGRSQAAKDRAQRLAIGWGLSAVLVDAMIVIYFAFHMSSAVFIDYMVKSIPIFAVPLIVATGFCLIHIFGLPVFDRALWRKVRSLEELDDLAAKFARHRRSARRRDLFSSNPQLRYAAVRSLTAKDMVRPRTIIELGDLVYATDIRKVVETEVNSTLRRALAQYLGNLQMHDVKITWPEQVYALGAKSTIAICGALLDSTDVELISAIKTSKPMRKAFNEGINHDTWREMILQKPVPNIQSVLRRLSPLEQQGLGTFDYLQNIAEIDNLYLFFRQWMYYKELDPPVLRFRKKKL